jgi:hypothetical protein
MPVSTIRLATERHAQCLFEQEQARDIQAGQAKGRTFIGEILTLPMPQEIRVIVRRHIGQYLTDSCLPFA